MDDPGEVWSRFASLAHASSHADDLVPIVEAAEWLPDGHRLVIAAHLANHLGRIEASSRMETLRKELAAALDSLLAELDSRRAGTLAAGLITNLDELSDLTRWRAVLHSARLLLGIPLVEDLGSIAVLCNMGLDAVLTLLRKRLQGRDIENVRASYVAFSYALTRYGDAARQLDRELGRVVFSTPQLLV